MIVLKFLTVLKTLSVIATKVPGQKTFCSSISPRGAPRGVRTVNWPTVWVEKDVHIKSEIKLLRMEERVEWVIKMTVKLCTYFVVHWRVQSHRSYPSVFGLDSHCSRQSAGLHCHSKMHPIMLWNHDQEQTSIDDTTIRYINWNVLILVPCTSMQTMEFFHLCLPRILVSYQNRFWWFIS